MNKAKEVIDGLDKAIELEHRVMEYYKRAGDEAKEAGPDNQIANAFYRIEERHQIHIERLEAQRERVHRIEGDGFLVDAMNSFSDALSNVVAGLPRSFIEGETFPTFETLAHCEEQLIEHYTSLLGHLDPETAALIEATIADCRDNIVMLQRIDPLG